MILLRFLARNAQLGVSVFFLTVVKNQPSNTGLTSIPIITLCVGTVGTVWKLLDSCSVAVDPQTGLRFTFQCGTTIRWGFFPAEPLWNENWRKDIVTKKPPSIMACFYGSSESSDLENKIDRACMFYWAFLKTEYWLMNKQKKGP